MAFWQKRTEKSGPSAEEMAADLVATHQDDRRLVLTGTAKPEVFRKRAEAILDLIARAADEERHGLGAPARAAKAALGDGRIDAGPALMGIIDNRHPKGMMSKLDRVGSRTVGFSEMLLDLRQGIEASEMMKRNPEERHAIPAITGAAKSKILEPEDLVEAGLKLMRIDQSDFSRISAGRASATEIRQIGLLASNVAFLRAGKLGELQLQTLASSDYDRHGWQDAGLSVRAFAAWGGLKTLDGNVARFGPLEKLVEGAHRSAVRAERGMEAAGAAGYEGKISRPWANEREEVLASARAFGAMAKAELGLSTGTAESLTAGGAPASEAKSVGLAVANLAILRNIENGRSEEAKIALEALHALSRAPDHSVRKVLGSIFSGRAGDVILKASASDDVLTSAVNGLRGYARHQVKDVALEQ